MSAVTDVRLSPEEWREIIDEMVELGAGKVLNGLVRRINKEIACESIGTPEQVEALIRKLG